jgi:hypothetical protein
MLIITLPPPPMQFGSLTWPGLESTIYHTWGKHASHYTTTNTTDAVWFFDLTGTWIHDLPHLRQTCQPLHYHHHHRCSLVLWPDRNLNPRSTTLEASMPTITLPPSPPSSSVLTRLFFILRKKHISFSLQI